MHRPATVITLAATAYLAFMAPAQARAVTAPALQTPSFDCQAVRTGAEWMVCNDPSLAAADRLQQRLYHQVMQADRPSRLASRALQRQWLKQRDGCASAACVGDLYGDNLATLAEASGFPGWAWLQRDDESADLRVFDNNDGWSAAYVRAPRGRDLDRGAVVQFVLMFPTGAQPATMSRQGCRIVVSPFNAWGWSVDTPEPCTPGDGDGIYRRVGP